MKPPRVLFAVEPYHIQARRTFVSRLVELADSDRFRPVIWSQAGPARSWYERLGVETYSVNEPTAQVMQEQRIDLVQTDGYSFQLALAARQAGIPHLFRLGATISQGVRNYQTSQCNGLIAALSQLGQKIVCPSHFIAAPLRRAGLENVSIIPNGVDLQLIQPRLRLPGPPRIIMVAHLLPSKRHLDFIQAARLTHEQCPEAQFVILGQEYDWPEARAYAQTVHQALASHPFIQLSSFDDIDQAPSADMLVLPSLDEGASNAVLEAMARAQPVIACQSGGHPEMVLSDQTGILVPPQDPGALARAIMELVQNPDRAQQMGQMGRERCRLHFDLREGLSRYLDTYAQLTLPRRIQDSSKKSAHN